MPYKTIRATQVWNSNEGAANKSFSPTIRYRLDSGQELTVDYAERQFANRIDEQDVILIIDQDERADHCSRWRLLE